MLLLYAVHVGGECVGHAVRYSQSIGYKVVSISYIILDGI